MKKTYYFPDSEHAVDFFGSENPVCIDHEELCRLAKGWDLTLDEIMDQVHEATDTEIKLYGTYDA